MKSLVLLSGGIDSTVALARTCAELAVSFDYGQTHRRQELLSATAVARHYNIPHIVKAIGGAPCALTGHGDIPNTHAEEPDATFVPGRNILMIANAVAIAQSHNLDAVVIGANADDRAGYPDCRPDFITELDHATRAGYGIAIWAPLLRMNKKQIIQYARELEVPLDLTWSCYRGGEQPCNKCGACESRNEALA